MSGILRKTKKLQSIIMAVVMVITLISTPPQKANAAAETGQTAKLAIAGELDYTQAYEILDLTNKERANYGVANKLVMDKELMDAAMLRAAEIALVFDHVRPNGEACYTASSKMRGENIAVNYSASAVMNSWMESTSGHRDAILNSGYNSIGIGVFVHNGRTYYVQCFGVVAATNAAQPEDVIKSVDVEILSSSLSEAKLAFSSSAYNVKAKSTINADVKMTNLGWGSASAILDPSCITYSVDFAEVAIVKDGVITPVSNGSTTVTAILKADASKKVTATVKCSGFVESVSLDESELILDTNGIKSAALKTTVLPSTAIDKTVSWSSSDASVAKVSSSGVVTAQTPGRATITVTANCGSKTATCLVTVYKTQDIPQAPTKKSATSDTIVLNDINGAEYSIDGRNWQKSSTFTGLQPDTEYTFYVRMAADGDYILGSESSEGTNIKTLPVYVTSVLLDREAMELEIGGENEVLTGKLIATVYPDNATDKSVIWKSSDENIASVDSSGNITAVGPGTATITVQATGGKEAKPDASCVVTVWKTPENQVLSPGTAETPTADTIILTPYESCEYRIAPDGAWQDSNIFSELQPDTEYTFEIRVKGNLEENIKPGESVEITVTTAKKKVEIVEVTGVAFVDNTSGERSIIIGESDSWSFTATVTPENATDKTIIYESSDEKVATIDENGKVIAVAPGETTLKATTKIGDYEDTIRLIVYKKHDKPPAPTLVSKTSNSVTLKKQSGCVYSMDGENWQESNVFINLCADTSYTFYVKKVANGYWLESEISEVFTVVTDEETSVEAGDDSNQDKDEDEEPNNPDGVTDGATDEEPDNPGGVTDGATDEEPDNPGGVTDGATDEDTDNSDDATDEDTYGEGSGEAVPQPFVAPDIKVSYCTHIQTFGWEGNEYDRSTWKSDGAMSGTSGLAKRLEGIKIVVEPTASCDELELGVQYTTHCQSYGWLPWSADGDMNGTQGEAKRLEAIMLQLTGNHVDYYDVYYRVHAQSYGWLGWAKNGEPAGTAGYGKRLEGIQIIVVKKGEDFDTNMSGIISKLEAPFVAKEGSSPIVNYPATSNTNPVVPGKADVNVAYRTHVQSFGWQGWKYNGAMSGTSGLAKRLEGININLTNKDCEGGIEYITHVQTYGWQGELNDRSTWKKNGEMSGTSKESKRLEAICIALTGEMSEYYDIYYRVHAQSFGWLSWAKNGQPAGTAGYGKRLEGIQIILVKKGEAPPSVNYGGVTSAVTQEYITK